MRAFLEQYGIAIFIIIILGIMTLMASGVGATIEGLLKNEIQRFTDKSVSENTKIINGTNNKENAEVLIGEAIAVYSNDDKSLTFYRVDTIPEEGTQFEGKTASNVYTDIETTYYYYTYTEDVSASTNPPPWQGKAIEIIEFKDTIRPISTCAWFQAYQGTTLDLSKLDTSQVRNMSFMFANLFYITSLDLSSFDTSSLEEMRSMFQLSTKLQTVNLSSFDTSKLKVLSYTFSCCYELENLILPTNFDTSKVETMGSMFAYCHKLKIDCSSWDVSSITYKSDFATGTTYGNIVRPIW